MQEKRTRRLKTLDWLLLRVIRAGTILRAAPPDARDVAVDLGMI
jgi:hypothetical protein